MPEPPENGVYGPARRHRTRPNRRRVPSLAASLVSELRVSVTETGTNVKSIVTCNVAAFHLASRAQRSTMSAFTRVLSALW
jgi:hypothetical protein